LLRRDLVRTLYCFVTGPENSDASVICVRIEELRLATLIKRAKYGKNKDGDPLPQINLALLYGEESMLPVYYRKLAGNITDVKTIENLLKDVDFLKLEKLKLVMDRGFYSEKNINDLMKHHHKFLIGAKTSLKIVSNRLDKIRTDFVTRFNYNSELKLYVMQSLLDEIDVIEYYQQPGRAHHLSEITEKQRKLYELMDIYAPT